MSSRQVVVTSFSPEGARIYGWKMVKSFRRFWDVPLVIYTDTPASFPCGAVRLTSDIQDWSALRASWQHDPSVHGCPDPAYPDREKHYAFVWDAARFAVKAFVICDAAERLKRGVLTWLDGDTVTTQEVDPQFTVNLLGDADVAYLGRRHLYPETGYLGLRLPEALPLVRWCRDAYVTGSFRALTDGWTDCHVFQEALRQVPVRARNLTAHVDTTDSHIWAYSPLADYLDHRKGRQRKAHE